MTSRLFWYTVNIHFIRREETLGSGTRESIVATDLFNTVMVLALFIVAILMMTYLAFKGRLTSRILLILLPGATLAVCTLTVLVSVQPLLPLNVTLFVAFTMLVASLALLCATIVLILSMSREAPQVESEDRNLEGSAGTEVEA